MKFRVLEGIFENDNWQSIQLLKEGHDKIYNREQVSLDFDSVIINTENGVIFYDIDSIDGVQLFYMTVEEILESIQQDMRNVENLGE